MRIHTDDDLSRIDRTFLGPKGRRLPWLATYRQYGVFLLVAVVLFILLDQLGYPLLNFWGFFYYVLGAVVLTRFVSSRMRDDVGLFSNIRTAWQEVDVPREHTGEARSWAVDSHKIDRYPAQTWPPLPASARARGAVVALLPAPKNPKAQSLTPPPENSSEH